MRKALLVTMMCATSAGVGALGVTCTLLALSTSGCASPAPTGDVVEAPLPDVVASVVVFSEFGRRVFRLHDMEAGIVCYVSDVYHDGGGIDCVPEGETRLVP